MDSTVTERGQEWGGESVRKNKKDDRDHGPH